MHNSQHGIDLADSMHIHSYQMGIFPELHNQRGDIHRSILQFEGHWARIESTLDDHNAYQRPSKPSQWCKRASKIDPTGSSLNILKKWRCLEVQSGILGDVPNHRNLPGCTTFQRRAMEEHNVRTPDVSQDLKIEKGPDERTCHSSLSIAQIVSVQ